MTEEKPPEPPVAPKAPEASAEEIKTEGEKIAEEIAEKIEGDQVFSRLLSNYVFS